MSFHCHCLEINSCPAFIKFFGCGLCGSNGDDIASSQSNESSSTDSCDKKNHKKNKKPKKEKKIQVPHLKLKNDDVTSIEQLENLGEEYLISVIGCNEKIVMLDNSLDIPEIIKSNKSKIISEYFQHDIYQLIKYLLDKTLNEKKKKQITMELDNYGLYVIWTMPIFDHLDIRDIIGFFIIIKKKIVTIQELSAFIK